MRRRPKNTMRLWLWLMLLLLAGALAWLYRSGDLAKRPMHTDEAILGMKTLEVMKTGHFQYDPHDYHGPLLHFSTRWLGEVLGWKPATLNEQQLRFVTVLYGMALLLIPLLLADVLGRAGTAFAALFIAVSPLMTFYSRYYIMETPFVFFAGLFIASLWRWSQSKGKLWLVLAGVSLGAMHAAKETFVLNMAAMAAGYVVARLLAGSFVAKLAGLSFSKPPKRSALPWIVVPLVAALVSVAFYSNFFHDWTGVKDSVLTYESYLHRSGGAGHAKPWDYYIKLLFWNPNALNRWNEALIGGLAIVGGISAFFNFQRPSHHRAFLIFLAVYAFGLLAIYSVIPYKTPWSILGVDHAFALLGGLGTSVVFRSLRGAVLKTIAGVLLTVAIYNLCHQTSTATDFRFSKPRYSAHELNPYVYSHTSAKLPELAKHVHELAQLDPAGKDMPVQVIDAESGWPLPWYLRDMPHVGYQTTVPQSLHGAAVVIVDGDMTEEVQAKLKPRPIALAEPADFVGPPSPPKMSGPAYDMDEPCSLRTHSSTLLNVLVRHDLMERFRKMQKPAP